MKNIWKSEKLEILDYCISHPDVSAREAGRRTGHSHGYVMRIWKEHHLY
ncbi:MarR family transcriptional regulator [Clostridium sp. AM58-1XD]|nr:MarR family transcriptional regulator [Clostridium sp. AM58-1XD]